MLRRDKESAISALQKAIRHENRASGFVEHAIKTTLAEFGVVKDALESRFALRLGKEHTSTPRLVMHASSVNTKG